MSQKRFYIRLQLQLHAVGSDEFHRSSLSNNLLIHNIRMYVYHSSVGHLPGRLAVLPRLSRGDN